MNQRPINFTASGDTTIYDTGAANRTSVYDFFLIVSGAGTVIIKDQAGTEFGRYTVAAAAQISRPPLTIGVPRFIAVGDIIINTSTSLTVTGDITLADNPN